MPTVGRVQPGDTLFGHLAPEQGCQCFYFEGLEYALLDYSLGADCGNATIKIEDPEGKPLDLESGSCSASAGKGIILHKTGTYRGLVCKAACDPETWYQFRYDIRLVTPFDQSLALTPCSKQEITFVAPRGSNVIVTISPAHKCTLVPKVLAVKDPDGGRALAPGADCSGAQVPTISDGRDGGRKLQFSAMKPGRYTVVVSSEETSGDAVAHVQVFPPKRPVRKLYHDGHPCPEGFTVPTSRVVSASTK